MSVATSYLNYLNQVMWASSSPKHYYSASATNSYIVGAPGGDAMWGDGSGDTLVGGGGDDTFYIYSPTDHVVETAGGVATVVASFYSPIAYTLPDNVENLTVSGTSVTAIGNSLDNLIIAEGSGNMTIDGGGGNDVMVANTGADTFVMDPGYGHDVIYNFNAAIDQIRLPNFNISNFDVIKSDMAQVGADVVITLDANDSITLRNTTAGQLSAGNFELSIDTSHLRMTFDDEFNTFNWSADGSHGWMTTFPYGGTSARTLPSNHEAEYYSDPSVGVNPFSDSNGVLTITAAPATPGVGTPAGSSLTYTSGLITTYHSFAQLYGYFEVRAELPTGKGFWPAFWLLPANNTWPPELDVLEQLGQSPSTIYETAHTNVGGTNKTTQFITNVSTAASGFHTYGVDWEPDTITWYIDGTAVAHTATPADMHTPMYMLLNLAVGGTGSWPGPADGTSSATMQIDYVRAYASAATLTAPTTQAVSYDASAGHTLSTSAATGVLANDTDQNGLAMTASLASGPTHGALTLHADGSFAYTPNAGFAGVDSFTYVASDSLVHSTPTKVTLDVAAHAPTSLADAYDASSGHSLWVNAAMGVLANDSDQNGLGLHASLAAGPAHGSLVLNADGSFTYTPTAGFAGMDSFTYVASDSLSHSTPTNAVVDVMTSVSGSGTTGSVDISQFDVGAGVSYSAGFGNKSISAGNSNALIDTGYGNDTVSLGTGTDTVKFGTGISTVTAGTGNDTFVFDAQKMANPQTHAGLMETISGYAGAGDPQTGQVHDFIWLENFSAGSSLQFHGYASPASQQSQIYDVVASNGQVENSFTVSVNLDHDGTYHHLAAHLDYAFA